ncbi:C-X-C motif chemokine 11-1-like [Engraulis encrasicolus]|uniref:C-X-C motif chemokine 11-1-like n=1 Tax=Engraulis encrasicolus TaxID=184585 RepID=UPI002FD0E3ED
MDTRVLLLLSLIASLALAQNNHGTERCTCRRIRPKLAPPKQILDIQILPPSPSCNKLEIVVTMKNGLQYCMEPKEEILQRVVRSLEKKNSADQLTTISPSDV